MFESWSLKKIIIILGGALLIVAIVQLILFFNNYSYYVHFGLSFVALFIALLLFHSVNSRLKQMKKRK